MRQVLKIAVALALALAAASCKAVEREPAYPRALVEPVAVALRSEARIALRYRVPPESAYYSGGVDHEQAGDTLRVVIARCAVGSPCEPMARSVRPLDDDWQAEVHLPYRGGRVVVVHSDGEQQLYPPPSAAGGMRKSP